MSIFIDSYIPIIIEAKDTIQVSKYLNNPNVIINDHYSSQLQDLIKTRNPSEESQSIIDQLIAKELSECSITEHGNWVFYPWSQHFVHLLAKDSFRELRSNRNQYKITKEEQKTLQSKRIGIVGLSVGHSVAMTLVLEGVGGHFRLADFDALDLSNLNRIRTGTHHLGVNKAIVAAREMFEIDPYLNIEIFTNGITKNNIGIFLGSSDKLDLLVEECDDLYVKIRIREVARQNGIPVIMETSDRGLLDVERFDLEPERELFHGAILGLKAEQVKDLSTQEKIPYILAIIGDKMSPRMTKSLAEIKKTISTWPQLGSAVALGGALVTDVSRRILLGLMQYSGRFYVDIETNTESSKSCLPHSTKLS